MKTAILFSSLALLAFTVSAQTNFSGGITTPTLNGKPVAISPVTPVLPTDIPNCNLWLRAGVGQYNAATGGTLVTTDGGVVERWEDQSGSANHCTQSTSGSAPLFNARTGGVCLSPNTAQYLNLPSGYAFNKQAGSVFFIARMITSQGLGTQHPLFRGASDGYNFFLSHYTSNVEGLYTYDGTVRGTTLLPSSNFGFMGVVAGASSQIVYLNGASSTLATASSGTISGGEIGGDGGGSWQTGVEIVEVIGYSRALSAAEVATLNAYAQARLSPAGLVNVVVDGDSITSSMLSTSQNNGWQRQIASGATPIDLYDSATPSNQLADLTSGSAYRVDVYRSTSKPNWLIIFAGTNDFTIGSRTAAQVYADTVSYCNARRTAGWTAANNCKIVILGILNRTSAIETARQAVRTSFLGDFTASAGTLTYGAGTGVTYADYYIDLGGDANIGAAGASANTAFFVDAIHPTDVGHSIIAGYVRALLSL